MYDEYLYQRWYQRWLLRRWYSRIRTIHNTYTVFMYLDHVLKSCTNVGTGSRYRVRLGTHARDGDQLLSIRQRHDVVLEHGPHPAIVVRAFAVILEFEHVLAQRLGRHPTLLQVVQSRVQGSGYSYRVDEPDKSTYHYCTNQLPRNA